MSGELSERDQLWAFDDGLSSTTMYLNDYEKKS